MDKTMEDANRHQGEQALMEMMQHIKTPDGRKSPNPAPSPASLVIVLNEERTRREDCEKIIQQLHAQLSSLQREKAVAEANCQRKDTVLLDYSHKWKNFESEWQQKLILSDEEKSLLISKTARLEGEIKIFANEARKSAAELQTITRQNEQSFRHLQEENALLKEKFEQSESELRKIKAQFDDNQKEVSRSESKLDESKREIRRLKNQIEDLKREKNKTDADLELLEDKYKRNELDWETHVQTIRQTAELDAERKLQTWQNEVESKLKHLITTLEHQLGILKSKSLEEMQLMETRHRQEIKVLKTQCSALQQKIAMQEKAQEELKNKMREHLSAQLNEMDRIAPSSGAWQQQRPFPPSEISDITTLSSDSTSTNARAIKRDEMQQFVNQVMAQRQSAPPPLKGSNKRSDPAPSRKK